MSLSLIQVGSLASALLACLALSRQLVRLITTGDRLIQSIDTLKTQVTDHQTQLQDLTRATQSLTQAQHAHQAHTHQLQSLLSDCLTQLKEVRYYDYV